MTTPLERLMRPGRDGAAEVRLDVLWLLALGVVLIAAGFGLRDPWPADEPRFALIARDMAASGEWLIPRIGGDLYADKPPLFFWIVSGLLLLTGSLRIAVFLPGLLAGLGAVLLTYDLARRLWSREAGLAAGLGLLATVQFVWEARQGRIDATLCFFTTLSLYGLLRHLLLGPAWRWWLIGWIAAGLGVITKGVGFLPLLILIPFGLAAAIWRPSRLEAVRGSRLRWMLGPIAMLATMSVWLAPMLMAASSDPALARYRDEILFSQTFGRYADAWHHTKPFWYFIVEVIPLMWAPLIALVPWLWPEWRARWQARDLRVWLPLAWVLMVVAFFSLSSGKRGVYLLPATPAFALACAPFLVELIRRPAARKMMFALACIVVGVTFCTATYVWVDADQRQALIDAYDLDVLPPLLTISLAAAALCAWARPHRGFEAFGGLLVIIVVIVGFWVNPVMNDVRSGVQFIRHVERAAAGAGELGLVAYKEQYLLHLTRPVVHFGHARWREPHEEAADAAAWLSAEPQRVLLIDEIARTACFRQAEIHDLGRANRKRWFLVAGGADPECVAKGRPGAAQRYDPRAGLAATGTDK